VGLSAKTLRWGRADLISCQWSPHPATSNLILSTSSQKLLVWDLAAQRCLHKSIDAHSRAITDINWHARNPDLIATVSMDAGIRGWDLRVGERPFMRLCAWGAAGTQVKWNRQHDHILATAHGKEVFVWDNRVSSVFSNCLFVEWSNRSHSGCVERLGPGRGNQSTRFEDLRD